MKPLLHLLAAAILTFRLSADPLGEFLFPPDLMQRAQGEVQLTDAQRQHIQEEAEKMGTRFREVQERVEKEADALGALMKPEHVDVPAALAQLDRLLDAEREVKRAQIGFMIAIKNQLTPEQQAKLAAFRKTHDTDRAAAEELQRRLTAKAVRVGLAVEKFADAGGDPAPVAAIMGEVRELMKQGKAKEAEAAVDRALKVLGEGK